LPAPGRTKDGLWNAIGRLIDLFPPAECANYLANSRHLLPALKSALVQAEEN
jgi:hypothetical protein